MLGELEVTLEWFFPAVQESSSQINYDDGQAVKQIRHAIEQNNDVLYQFFMVLFLSVLYNYWVINYHCGVTLLIKR